MSPKQAEKLLTETELELMNILWQLGKGSVNDVMAELPAERKLAYTSVSTILRILEQKGTLTSEKQGRSHTYTPTLPKKRYEEKSLKHLLDNVFNGAPVSLVRTLLSAEKLSKEELANIQKLLKERVE